MKRLFGATLAIAAVGSAVFAAPPPAVPGQPLAAVSEALCNGSNDDTAAIVRAGRAAGGVLVIPPNCKFDRVKVLEDLPKEALLIDLSGINGFASPGETTKSVGIFSQDAAENDSQWLIGSGHHPVLNLNNFGTGGTESAVARRGTILWSSGEFANSASKEGFRGAGMLQFGREPGRDQWSLSLRSLAPFAALRENYEMWRAGEVIPRAGIYRSTGEAMLVSTSAGTTGLIAPDGLVGTTLRDGSVAWQAIDSSDRSIFRITQHGRVLFGLGDFSASFRHKVSIAESGDNVAEWAATGVSKDVITKWLPTDEKGTETSVPGLRANAVDGLVVVAGSDYATPLVRFEDHRGLVAARMALDGSVIRPDGPVLAVDGKALIFVRGGAGTIDRLTGGVAGQLLALHFLEAGTTLVNGTGFDAMHLEGSRSLQVSADTVIELRRLPDELGGRWVETGRSVK